MRAHAAHGELRAGPDRRGRGQKCAATAFFGQIGLERSRVALPIVMLRKPVMPRQANIEGCVVTFLPASLRNGSRRAGDHDQQEADRRGGVVGTEQRADLVPVQVASHIAQREPGASIRRHQNVAEPLSLALRNEHKSCAGRRVSFSREAAQCKSVVYACAVARRRRRIARRESERASWGCAPNTHYGVAQKNQRSARGERALSRRCAKREREREREKKGKTAERVLARAGHDVRDAGARRGAGRGGRDQRHDHDVRANRLGKDLHYARRHEQLRAPWRRAARRTAPHGNTRKHKGDLSSSGAGRFGRLEKNNPSLYIGTRGGKGPRALEEKVSLAWKPFLLPREGSEDGYKCLEVRGALSAPFERRKKTRVVCHDRRAIAHVFAEVGLRIETQYTIICTYMEIYNERIFDLLHGLSQEDARTDYAIVEARSLSVSKTL